MSDDDDDNNVIDLISLKKPQGFETWSEVIPQGSLFTVELNVNFKGDEVRSTDQLRNKLERLFSPDVRFNDINVTKPRSYYIYKVVLDTENMTAFVNHGSYGVFEGDYTIDIIEYKFNYTDNGTVENFVDSPMKRYEGFKRRDGGDYEHELVITMRRGGNASDAPARGMQTFRILSNMTEVTKILGHFNLLGKVKRVSKATPAVPTLAVRLTLPLEQIGGTINESPVRVYNPSPQSMQQGSTELWAHVRLDRNQQTKRLTIEGINGRSDLQEVEHKLSYHGTLKSELTPTFWTTDDSEEMVNVEDGGIAVTMDLHFELNYLVMGRTAYRVSYQGQKFQCNFCFSWDHESRGCWRRSGGERREDLLKQYDEKWRRQMKYEKKQSQDVSTGRAKVNLTTAFESTHEDDDDERESEKNAGTEEDDDENDDKESEKNAGTEEDEEENDDRENEKNAGTEEDEEENDGDDEEVAWNKEKENLGVKEGKKNEDDVVLKGSSEDDSGNEMKNAVEKDDKVNFEPKVQRPKRKNMKKQKSKAVKLVEQGETSVDVEDVGADKLKETVDDEGDENGTDVEAEDKGKEKKEEAGDEFKEKSTVKGGGEAGTDEAEVGEGDQKDTVTEDKKDGAIGMDKEEEKEEGASDNVKMKAVSEETEEIKEAGAKKEEGVGDTVAKGHNVKKKTEDDTTENAAAQLETPEAGKDTTEAGIEAEMVMEKTEEAAARLLEAPEAGMVKRQSVSDLTKKWENQGEDNQSGEPLKTESVKRKSDSPKGNNTKVTGSGKKKEMQKDVEISAFKADYKKDLKRLQERYKKENGKEKAKTKKEAEEMLAKTRKKIGEKGYPQSVWKSCVDDFERSPWKSSPKQFL